MMSGTTRIINHSVTEYLKFIFEINRNHTDIQGRIRGAVDYSYRGISNSKFQLIPSAFRPMYRGINNENREVDIFNDFKIDASALIPNYHNLDTIELLTYAQHFGVPPRLLDFTSNPLVALYFCCSNSFDVNGSVWVLVEAKYRRISKDPKKKKSEQIADIVDSYFTNTNSGQVSSLPISFIPNYIDHRMSVQESRMLLWGSKEEPLEKMIENRFLTPKSQIPEDNSRQDEYCLYRLDVPGESKKVILDELDQIGINEKTLFPGLDGLGRYIQNRFRRNTEI